MRAMEISRSGLDVEWQRLQVIAQNLANINTTRSATGEAYRPMRLLSGPQGGFSAMMSGTTAARGDGGVRVVGVEPAAGNIRRVYEPGHPDAAPDGFVSYPAVDHAGEMTLLIKTSRAYEANLTAMNMAHQMYSRALDLGRQS
ncbi:flagellar basal body rod protein FlgC [Allosphingosinicella deserti]|uniref:Flagellar basal-body rod protein FlgC n=1 Tax=Allosphingosinicella deserti TaxID=2116704 RepID=A0A2P7QW94_9SPHN|nr:flagellar basal body rod protein FlgC [Sphingomonas deserti]PSJ42209.1 flagellar basal body rod protein FlgC [Sphingomonas deserti]